MRKLNADNIASHVGCENAINTKGRRRKRAREGEEDEMGGENADETNAMAILIPLDFSRYGRSWSARRDDFNSLNYGNYPFETRWIRRRVATRRVRKRTKRGGRNKRGKEKQKKPTRETLVRLDTDRDFLRKIRYSCLTKSPRGWDANIGRALWLITLSRMRINPRAEGARPRLHACVYVCTCMCRAVNMARRNRSRLYRVRWGGGLSERSATSEVARRLERGGWLRDSLARTVTRPDCCHIIIIAKTYASQSHVKWRVLGMGRVSPSRRLRAERRREGGEGERDRNNFRNFQKPILFATRTANCHQQINKYIYLLFPAFKRKPGHYSRRIYMYMKNRH